MGILFGFIFLSVGLIFLAGLIGLIIWLYRKFIRKDATATPLFTTAPLVFPARFNWALGLVLLGFHVGLYNAVSYVGPEMRVPAAGLAVFTAVASCAWLFLLNKKRSPFLYSVVAVGILSGFWLFWRANGFVQTWNFIFFALSQLILYIWFVKDELPKTVGSWLGTALALIPISFLQGLRVLISLVKREGSQKATFFGWLKTAIIALLVLAVFLGLLSQADPVFAEIVKDFRSQLMGRAMWTIVLTFLAALWWTISFKKETPEAEETQAGWLTYRDVVTVLTVVVITVGVFLAVQFKYLFGGSRELLNTLDLTFSEYVRKGFTELLAAVFIGGVLSYMAGIKTRFWEPAARKTAQILNMVMVVELGFLLLSALKRDLLYVETYGLTRVRVVGGVFLIWLAFFLVVLLVYGWHKIKEKVALTVLWFGAVLVLVSLNVMNVDTLVARGAPGHHEYTDYFYLMQLSEDAAENWVETLGEIEADTNALVGKSELSNEDRAQLAGLKLGVLSFMENRDSLYTRYASTEWLQENHQKIGLTLLADSRGNQDPYNWSQSRSIIETSFPSPTQQAQQLLSEQKVIPKSLQKYRSWEFANASEKRAFELIQADEERAFELPYKLLSDILRYQISHQVSLDIEERRLLEELKYQFITVDLKRYWPSGLQTLEVRDLADLPPYVREELSTLEKSNTSSLAQLAGLSCGSSEVQSGQPITVYGVLRKLNNPVTTTTATQSANLKTYELKEFAGTNINGSSNPVIQIIASTPVKFGGPSRVEDVYGVTSGGMMKPPSQAMYDTESYLDYASATFVKTIVKPTAVASGASCAVQFTGEDITAFQAF